MRPFLVALTVFSLGCSEDPKPLPPPPPQIPAGALLEVHGQVSLTRGTPPALPATPQPLFVNDVVATGPESTAVLRAKDGAVIELGEETRFRVGQKQGAVSLELQAGAISIAEGGEGGIVVLSEFGSTRLTPGGKASLELGAAGLSISVALGSITIDAEDGGQQTAAAGQRLKVRVGSIEILEDPTAKPEELSLPPIELVLTREAGSPLLKKKGAPRFSPAPKGATPIAEGTAFQLPAGARARLSTAGLSMSLASGASGLLGQAAVDAGGRMVKLDLTSGSGATLFDGSAPMTLVIAGAKKELQLLAKGEAAVTVTQTKTGPKLEVHAGEVEVLLDGKPTVVKAGERADLSGAKLQVGPRPRPALVLPVDRKVRVFAVRLGEVGLATPTAGAARVQVATDAAFSALLVSGKVSEPLVVVPAPAAGELHWQVLDAEGKQLHKGQARFSADRDAKGAEKPKSEVAETGLKALVYFQSELPTLTFTFPAREEARRHRVRIYRASDLVKPLVEREVTETRCTVEAGLLTEGSYVWYAAPLDAKGNEKAGGRMNKLDIEYDNTLTTLVIKQPRVGARSDAAAGTAPLGARLFINGKTVALDSEGRFSVPLAGAEAIFRLVEKDGDESYWVRRSARP